MALAIEDAAFGKMVLHACRYPNRPVFGVLIAKRSGASSRNAQKEEGRIDSKSEYSICDSVPLCHNFPTSPLLQIAMAQVDEYCRRKSTGLEAVGVYYANDVDVDGANDTSGQTEQKSASEGLDRLRTAVSETEEVSSFSTRLASKIVENCTIFEAKSVVIVQIVNHLIASLPKSTPLRVFDSQSSSSKRWNPSSRSVSVSASARQRVVELIRSLHSLRDFKAEATEAILSIPQHEHSESSAQKEKPELQNVDICDFEQHMHDISLLPASADTVANLDWRNRHIAALFASKG